MSSTTSTRSSPITAHPTALLSPNATLTGSHPITLAANAVVHLRAKIIATHAPVSVGEGCIISERTSVGVLEPGEDSNEGVVLGKGVVLETGAVVEGVLGEGTIVDVGGKVGAGCVVGKHCKIGPLCSIPPNTTLLDFTVVYGNNERRIERPGLENIRAVVGRRHVEILRGLGVGKGK